MNAPANQQALARVDHDAQNLPMVSTSSASLILDSASMDSMMRLADIMSTGKVTIPVQYRNSPGDCLAVIMQAVQWKMNPFAVAQKTFFVSGTIGYEGQLVHAAVVSSGVISKDDFDYEFFGPWENVIGKFEIKKGDKGEYRVPGWHLSDEIGCGLRISATLRATGKVKVLEILLAQARTRNSTLWADDPQQQLGYLAVRKWARRHAPGVILGVYTPDELDDEPREMRDITPAPSKVSSPAELPECTDEVFKENTPAWRAVITSKKKTPAALIATLSTRAVLSEAQKLTIDSWAHESE